MGPLSRFAVAEEEGREAAGGRSYVTPERQSGLLVP
jgi:hypothetical protein